MPALLERWLRAAGSLPAPLRDGACGEVVDRLVVATQLRYPVVGDLARSVRYEVFERPLIEAARERVYRGVREQLDRLAAGPDGPRLRRAHGGRWSRARSR